MESEFFTTIMLLGITCAVWYTSQMSHGFWHTLYKYVPPMVLLFLIPSLLGSFSILHAGDSEASQFALSVLLPVTLILLTMTINFRDLLALSRKSILVFLAGTVGIVVGGPIALWLVGQLSPGMLADRGADSVWRGLVCISGSWINGTPGQTSMKEIFGSSNELYFVMLAVDTVVQNLWLAFLFFGVRTSTFFDRMLRADQTELQTIQQAGLERQQQKSERKLNGRFFSRLALLSLLCLVGYLVLNQFTLYTSSYFL